MTAVAELSLVPALLLMLAPPILRERNRNLPILAVLTTLWIIDLVFTRALYRGDIPLAAGAMRGAVNLVLVLVTVIAGRIIPAFTGNALRRAGSETVPATHRWLEVLAIGSVVAIAVCDLDPAG